MVGGVNPRTSQIPRSVAPAFYRTDLSFGLTCTSNTMKLLLEGAVMAVDWLPDGKRVVTASWDNTAKLWDAERSTVIQTLTGVYKIFL